MRKTVFAPLAALTVALMTTAPLAALAQTAAPVAPAPAEAPAATSASPAGASKVLTDLGATDIQLTRGKRDMQRASGKFADGTPLRAMLGQDGALRMIGADGDAALPVDVQNRLIPDSVRKTPVFAEFARVDGVMLDGNQIGVRGKDKAGLPLRAGFDRDGTLQRFGRGGDAHHKGYGQRMKGERKQQGDKKMPGRGASLSDDAARAALGQGGYTQPGTIRHDGPMTLIEAVNAGGQSVTVTLDPAGRIVRETAR